MPRGDCTGPAGFCAGYDVPGYMNVGLRSCGVGHGWGWRHWNRPGWEPGYGWRRWGGPGYYPPETRLENLREYARSLEQELEQIRQEIQSLERGREENRESD